MMSTIATDEDKIIPCYCFRHNWSFNASRLPAHDKPAPSLCMRHHLPEKPVTQAI